MRTCDDSLTSYFYSLSTPSLTFSGDWAKVTKLALPEIKNVIFNDPATIVVWADGSKTVVKCRKDKGDIFNKESGLALAIVKKAYGNRGNFNDIFKKWCHSVNRLANFNDYK